MVRHPLACGARVGAQDRRENRGVRGLRLRHAAKLEGDGPAIWCRLHQEAPQLVLQDPVAARGRDRVVEPDIACIPACATPAACACSPPPAPATAPRRRTRTTSRGSRSRSRPIERRRAHRHSPRSMPRAPRVYSPKTRTCAAGSSSPIASHDMTAGGRPTPCAACRCGAPRSTTWWTNSARWRRPSWSWSATRTTTACSQASSSSGRSRPRASPSCRRPAKP